MLSIETNSNLNETNSSLREDDVKDIIFENLAQEHQNTYVNRLKFHFDKILQFLDLPESINQNNYKEIFEEYALFIFSFLEEHGEIQKIIKKQAGIYKNRLSRKRKIHDNSQWIGESFLILKNIIENKGNIKEQEKFKKIQEEKEKELKIQEEKKEKEYLPQILSFLENFKKFFMENYFLKSPGEIKKAFHDEFIRMVREPTQQLDPNFFSEKELTSLPLSHWKNQLHDLKNLFAYASDLQIEKGIEQGFFFGDLDDMLIILESRIK